MEAGRVLERGNHHALLALNGRYAQMWALQQSGESDDGDGAAGEKAALSA